MPLEDREILQTRNLVKSTTQPMPPRGEVGSLARTRMDQAESRAQVRSVQSDPSMNPAGKGQFRGAYAPMGNTSQHFTYAKPDASHAARLRGNKARKTWQQKAQGK